MAKRAFHANNWRRLRPPMVRARERHLSGIKGGSTTQRSNIVEVSISGLAAGW